MNQLAVIEHPSNVDAYRASTDAAAMCKDIVVATATTIQGRRYVAVEGWQAIAVAHGCTAGARSVERVEGGVRAIGEVRRMSDGTVIATAEGFVGEDEPTWYGGSNGRGRTLPKRPDYAIRAMAQTRAISRACRSAFAHVVVMMNAGLATTPAEEVPFDGFDQTPRHDPETGEIDAETVITDPNHPDREPAAREKLEGPHSSKTALRTAVHDIIAKVRAAETVDALNTLLKDKATKTTIAQAEFYWPSLIVGRSDLEEDTGLKGAVAAKRAEIEEGAVVSGLIESMKDCQTSLALTNWRAANEEAIEALDGAEGRKFELAWNFHESAVQAMETASA